MKTIVIDLDGVLFNSHQLYTEINKQTNDPDKQIDLFYQQMMSLKSNSWCLELICNLIKTNKIVFITARKESYAEQTELQVIRAILNYAASYHPNLTSQELNNFEIYAMANEDNRTAAEYKESIIEHIGKSDILFALDDDPEVSDMYYRNNIPSLNIIGLSYTHVS